MWINRTRLLRVLRTVISRGTIFDERKSSFLFRLALRFALCVKAVMTRCLNQSGIRGLPKVRGNSSWRGWSTESTGSCRTRPRLGIFGTPSLAIRFQTASLCLVKSSNEICPRPAHMSSSVNLGHLTLCLVPHLAFGPFTGRYFLWNSAYISVFSWPASGISDMSCVGRRGSMFTVRCVTLEGGVGYKSEVAPPIHHRPSRSPYSPRSLSAHFGESIDADSLTAIDALELHNWPGKWCI